MNPPDLIQLVATFALAGFLGLLVLGSGTVWWEAIRRWREGRPPLPPQPYEPPHWNRFVIGLTIAFVTYQLLNRIAAEALGAEIELTLRSVQFTVAVSLGLVAMLLLLLSRGQWAALAPYGIHAHRPAAQIVAGLLGFLGSVLPVLGVIAMTVPFRSPEAQHPFFKILEQESGLVTAGWIIGAAVITAPLAEELLFRVIFQGWLTSVLRPVPAIVITAVLFAAVHGFPDALPLLPLALLLGYVFHQTHSYLAVVVMHAAFNAMNLAIALIALLLQK